MVDITPKRSASFGVIPDERISGTNRENSVGARELHERSVHACIGGRSIGEDIRKLDYGVHIVSGRRESLRYD